MAQQPAIERRGGASAVPKVGIGHRREIDDGIFENRARFDCLEIIADSYLRPSWRKLRELERLREFFELVPHGLTLSIGTARPPDATYLAEVARLLDWIEAPYHSDHLALTSADGIGLGHLSPIWFTQQSLATVIRNVQVVQDRLKRRLVLETIADPFPLPEAEMSMPEFLHAVCSATDCGVLLDVTNIHINATNTGTNARDIVDALPLRHVQQLHIVGYGRDASRDGRLVDSHDADIQPELWALYDHVLSVCRPQVVVIERDDRFPAMASLVAEADRARRGRDARTSRPRSTEPALAAGH